MVYPWHVRQEKQLFTASLNQEKEYKKYHE